MSTQCKPSCTPAVPTQCTPVAPTQCTPAVPAQCTPSTPTNVPVSSITLSKTSVILDIIGATTTTLTATANPSNATNKSVTWSSSNTAIATVSSSGVVTAKTTGSAVITVKSNSNLCIIATCSVTVASTEIGFSPKTLDLYLGSVYTDEKNKLQATIATSSNGEVIPLTSSEISYYVSGGNTISIASGSSIERKPNGISVLTMKLNALREGPGKVIVSARGVTRDCDVRVLKEKPMLGSEEYFKELEDYLDAWQKEASNGAPHEYVFFNEYNKRAIEIMIDDINKSQNLSSIPENYINKFFEYINYYIKHGAVSPWEVWSAIDVEGFMRKRSINEMVFLGTHPAFNEVGQLTGNYHSAVIIFVNRNSAYYPLMRKDEILFEDVRYMTLGGVMEPVNINFPALLGSIDADNDNKSDRDLFKKSSIQWLFRDANNKIQELINAAQYYSDNSNGKLSYALTPVTGTFYYNSNSYAHGLLLAVNIPCKDPGNSPGWNNPIPAKYFRKE